MRYPPIDDLVRMTGSKYALVHIAARRARQLLETKKPYIEKPRSHRDVGIALEELYEHKIYFKRNG
ncbi:DNA-directed RNA polymerase subunit omega [[Clostridium] ultunense Esp]|nr:DNA-directed RNA polymerase subunit omega [[Clostridium] ultunense Esp]